MARGRTLVSALVIVGSLISAGGAAAHQAKPFTGATKDTKVVDRTTVRTTVIVTNSSKRPRRARCVVQAYSGAQGTSVTTTVSLRVPPYRKGAGYHWAEDRVTLRFDQGPIKPVSTTVPHCHRA
jgi:hypothetical protein